MKVLLSVDGSRASFAYIRWNHSIHHVSNVIKTDIDNTIPLSKTSCKIDFFDSKGNALGHVEGSSKVSPRDFYNKELGRKLTLKRAMKDIEKPIRTALWEAYLNRKSR
jgi:hypothetical protein